MKRGIIIIVVVMLFLSANCFAQTPNWAWAKQANGASTERGFSVATDAAGNVYATGGYDSTMNLGSISLMNSGSANMFSS